MKKMYTVFFLIFLVVFLFAGCNWAKLKGGEGTATDAGGEAVVTDSGDTVTDPSVPDLPTELPSNTEDPSAQEETTASGEPVVSPAGDTEWDILRTGTFEISGSMTDVTGTKTPMDMAVTPDSVYMYTDMDGVKIGMLLNGESVYMVYHEGKAYLEMDDSLMKTAGLSPDELQESLDSMQFSQFGTLAEASKVESASLNGHNCTVYVFEAEAESMKVYMDGEKLISFRSYDNAGKMTSATDVDSISATVSADKINPPSSYKKYSGMAGMFSFFMLFAGDMM